MNPLEEKIGHKFRNSLLLAEALTHPSLAYETQKPHFDNQRLEFLGDAVLQLILTEDLYCRFPEFAEGMLTKLRSRLVSRTALQEYSRALGLGEYLLIGKGEEASGGRERPSTLADAFEALVGAIYLDSGFEPAKTFVLNCCEAKLEKLAASPIEKNPKGELQEILQSLAQRGPSYRIVDEAGPDHQRRFVAEVIWGGRSLGNGEGNSKKEAEAAAARLALRQRLWENGKTATAEGNGRRTSREQVGATATANL